ncbi:hypothetical protein C0V77_22670 [Emticicia sp. TH156]|nr:hypothetical protein C0V77_22670 [Emticicia sp. TH156]
MNHLNGMESEDYTYSDGYSNMSVRNSTGSISVSGGFEPLQGSQPTPKKTINPVTPTNKGNVSKVSWGETSGIYPTKTLNPTEKELNDPTKWDMNKVQQLMEARASIDYIYNNVNKDAHTNDIDAVGKDKLLAPYHLKDNFPEVPKQIKDLVKGRGFFYLASKADVKTPSISDKYWDQTIVKSYGPFTIEGEGMLQKVKFILFFIVLIQKRNENK